MNRQSRGPKHRSPRRPAGWRPGSILFVASLSLGLATVAAVTMGALAAGPQPKSAFQVPAARQLADGGAVTPAPKPAAPAFQPENSAACLPLQRQAGTVAARGTPGGASEFIASNFWSGPVGSSGGAWYQAWAGTQGDRGLADSNLPPAVLLYLGTPTPDGCGVTESRVGLFTDPSANGPFIITGESGTLLELATRAGGEYTFDLQTHQYAAATA